MHGPTTKRTAACRFDRFIARFLLLLLLPALLVRCVGCAEEAVPRAASSIEQPSEPAKVRPLTVMTWNIHHGEGMDGRLDLERIAEVIRSAGADLVALQEVDLETRRTNGVDQVKELARLLDMRHLFGRAIDRDGGEYGVAILSRFEIMDFKNEALPHTQGFEPRTALMVDVAPWKEDEEDDNDHDGGRAAPVIRFISTHWQHNHAGDRAEQARRVDALFGLDDPNDAGEEAETARPIVILAGDLNAGPASKPLSILENRWRYVSRAADSTDWPLTWPADAPRASIDHVLISPASAEVDIRAAEVIEEAVASDHRPVVVRLEIR